MLICLSVDLGGFEFVEFVSDFIYQGPSFGDAGIADKFQIRGKQQEVQHFKEAAKCNFGIPRLLFSAAATIAFRDVAADGNDGPADLVGNAKSLCLRKFVADLIDPANQGPALLPDVQFFK